MYTLILIALILSGISALFTIIYWSLYFYRRKQVKKHFKQFNREYSGALNIDTHKSLNDEVIIIEVNKEEHYKKFFEKLKEEKEAKKC